jgi:hypothetical protein
LTGEAFCVVTTDNREFPIAFEVKVNTVNQSVTDVKYDFIEAVSEFAPSRNEEV